MAPLVPDAEPEPMLVKVFWGLSILSGTVGGMALLFALAAWPDRSDSFVFASVALGCCLHFAFLWAVLHLLSHILGRMERKGK